MTTARTRTHTVARVPARGAPVASLIVLGIVLVACPARPALADPWRIDDLIPTDVVSLTVDQRTRYEYLSEQFRTVQIGGPDDQAVVLRTLVHGRVTPIEGITLGAELEDSRAYVVDDTVLTTTVVNAVELLRAYLEIRREDLLGGELRLTGGRMTMDVGSRRLVARNRFRNTINGFTGIDLEWTGKGESRTVYRAFWTLPQQRRPTAADQAALHDNEIEIDRESLDQQLWGLFASNRTPSGLGLDLYVLGLHERDGEEQPTANRSIYTAGGRLLRAPAAGHLDYSFEGVLQWGESRDNAIDPDAVLDHFAYFFHLDAGYTFDVAWRPRLVLQWDYASGDKDPGDAKNGRFDTLFGARRFELGPTGIYGAFARSNLNTPGVRLEVEPGERVSAFLAYRAAWLAQKRDAWAGTGVRDTSGQSGSFLGDQIEVRLRWKLLPGNVHLEAGWAHLFRGRFMKEAPNAVATRDSDYVYTQASLSF